MEIFSGERKYQGQFLEYRKPFKVWINQMPQIQTGKLVKPFWLAVQRGINVSWALCVAYRSDTDFHFNPDLYFADGAYNAAYEYRAQWGQDNPYLTYTGIPRGQSGVPYGLTTESRGYYPDLKCGFVAIPEGTFSGMSRLGTYLTPGSDFRNFEFGIENILYAPDDLSFWSKIWNLAETYNPPKPYEEDPSGPGGGDGDWGDDGSDPVDPPTPDELNTRLIGRSRLVSLYRLSDAQLTALGNGLWGDDIISFLSNTALKPQDFIISLLRLPFTLGGGSNVAIKAGAFVIPGATGTLLASQFGKQDCGTLEIKEKWASSIDYQTSVSLYLPYIGEVTLNTQEVMGATIGVSYNIDVMTGTCVAFVKVTRGNLNSVLYSYNGNCGIAVPITSADYSRTMAGILGAAKAFTGSTGNMLGLVDNVSSNLLSAAPGVNRSGTMGNTAGFMGIQKPYLILSRPVQSLPEGFNTYSGYTSNITRRLGDLSGYTKVSKIHVSGIAATQAERDEIETLLKEGVIMA